MKITKIKEELRNLSYDELKEQAYNISRELFNSKLASKTSHVKDNSRYSKLRKLVARIQTFMQQKKVVGQ